MHTKAWNSILGRVSHDYYLNSFIASYKHMHMSVWTWSSLAHKKGYCPLHTYPDRKVHGANMGPTWVLSAPDGPHVVPINFAIWLATKIDIDL